MADLLDSLGKKPTVEDEGTAASKTSAPAGKATKKAAPKPVADLVDAASKDDVDEGTVDAISTTTEADENDPFATWTKEQLAEALKETRQEAAKRRVEVKDVSEKLQADYEAKIKQIEEKFTPLVEKADKFEKLKADEADKKRSLEEKLGHREQLINQRDEELRTLRDELSKGKQDAENRIQQLRSNLEAHESYYTDQLDKEKAEIPKKFQDLVDTMIKGSSDSKHALELLRTAKRENLFGEKKVVVNHSVPSAKTGARTDSASAQQDKRNSLKSSEKIREGLKSAIPQMMEKKRTFGL